MFPEETLSGTDLTVTVGKQVGSGTHWQTFRARTRGGGTVAVRTLQETIPPDAYDRFESLAAQWHTVSNEGTVRTLLDWGTDPEPWVAVDYVPGELESYATGTSIEAAVECDLATRTELLRDICDAIRSYGRYGSTRAHLGIGPESVSFREGPDGPTAVVGDWGISRLVGDPPVTPYTAPEQVAVDDRDGNDGGHAGQATDVYRIGALGVHLFSGSPPFPNDGSSLSDRIRRGIDEEAGFPDVADGFVPALRRATARDPADRHEGVYQLGRDVSAAAPRVPPGERSVAALLSPEEDAPVEKAGSDESVDGESNEVKTDTEPTDEDEDVDGLGGDPTDDGDDDIDPNSGPTGADDGLLIRVVGKAAAIGVIALIVLLAGAFGAIHFGLIGGGDDTVQGTVYVDADGSETVEDLEVTLETTESPSESEEGAEDETEGDPDENGDSGTDLSATTDEDGAFAIEDVDEGEYVLTVAGTDHIEYGETDVEVPSDDAGDLDIRPDRAFISGEVVDAQTGEPISTKGDGEVNATIELVDTSGENEGVVDAVSGGDYGFTVAEFDGNYTVNADADGYESDSLEIEAFGEQDAIELDQVTMSLSGEVIDSREDGRAIEDATVTITTDAGQEFTATTDADGNYETEEAIPVGVHDIEVEADGYVTESDTVEFEDGNVEGTDFELDAEASMTGVGTDDNGNALRFTYELEKDGELIVDGATDSETGEYQIEGLAPGEYTLTAERGNEVGSADIELAPREQLEASFEYVTETASIEITVVS